MIYNPFEKRRRKVAFIMKHVEKYIYQKLLNTIRRCIQNKKEMARDAAIGKMASRLAHDVRSSLASVDRYLRQNVNLDEDTAQMRDAAKRSLEKLLQMTDDFMNSAKALEIKTKDSNAHNIETIAKAGAEIYSDSSILVIDDDPKIRKQFKEIVKNITGNTPIEMKNGEQLLRSTLDFSKIRVGIINHKFKNCILDGFDILEHLKHKKVPVLCLCTSMHEDAAIIKAAKNLGVKHILPKPINEGLIREILQ